MTKEEYEKLLQSDYWKGYSYSLIKERNFTCEDCGRSFPNMRNMLQVHHLVYRDANPWSYNPEELIVLCKECHQKRHGIYTDAEPDIKEEVKEEATTVEENTTQTYTNTYTEEMRKRYACDNSPRKKRNWFKFAVLAYVIIYLFYLVLKDDSREQTVQETTTPIETSVTEKGVLEEPKEETPPVAVKKKSVTKKQATQKKSSNAEMEKPLVGQKQSIAIERTIQPGIKISKEEKNDSMTNGKSKSTIELPKEVNRTNVNKTKTNRTAVRKDIWEKVNRKSF